MLHTCTPYAIRQQDKRVVTFTHSLLIDDVTLLGTSSIQAGILRTFFTNKTQIIIIINAQRYMCFHGIHCQ